MSRLFIVEQIKVGIDQAPSFSNIAELADMLKRSEQCCFSVRVTGTTDADITPAPIGEQSHVDQEELGEPAEEARSPRKRAGSRD